MPSKRDLARERRELEEESRAIDEDRHRYDDVLPGLNDWGTGFCPVGRKPPELPHPPGYDLGPNLLAFRDETPASSRPRDAEPVLEHLIQQTVERIPAAPIGWLWPGRIPNGKLTLLAGDPGVGKSLVTLDLAARVSQGLPWPDAPDRRARIGRVLILSAEDGEQDTIRPRLERAGACLERVELAWGVSGYDQQRSRQRTWQQPLTLPDDIPALESLLRLFRCGINGELDPDLSDPTSPYNVATRLMIIDPLSAYLPAANTHDNVQVRKLLQPLVDLAARYRLAIVGVTHLNKAFLQPGQYRTMGSLAFTAVARAVWGVARDPANPERRLLLPIKSNLGPLPPGLSFHISDNHIDWDPEPVETNWNAAVAWNPNERIGAKLLAAMQFLVAALSRGERSGTDVEKDASKFLIAKRTLERARKKLHVHADEKMVDGKKRWVWSLPILEHLSTHTEFGGLSSDPVLPQSTEPVVPQTDP